MFIFTHILLKHISFDGSLSASTTIFSVQLDPVKRSAANSRKRQVSQKMAPFSILPTGVSCDHHGLNRWVVERFESYRLVIWIFARLSATNALCKFSLLPRNDNSWPPAYIFHNFPCRKKKFRWPDGGVARRRFRPLIENCQFLQVEQENGSDVNITGPQISSNLFHPPVSINLFVWSNL